MKNLKSVLLEQKEKKGNGCSTYGISAQDIRENCNGKSIPISEADYVMRIIVKTKTGHMLNSIKDAKKEYFAVKDGEIFKTDFFAPDGRYLKNEQWSWDITDDIAERPVIEMFNQYEAACNTYHKQNPTDSRIEYDCFCWFKGTNTVIIAPNYSEVRGKFPNNTKNIIRKYSEIHQ